MKTWLLVLAVCVIGSSADVGPRSINLALNTAVNINEDEAPQKIEMIEKIEMFLKTIKGVLADLSDNKSKEKLNFHASSISSLSDETSDADNDKSNNRQSKAYFTDFMDHLLTRVLHFKNYGLRRFIIIFNEESRKFDYEGSKFNRTLKDSVLRRALSNFVHSFLKKSDEKLRYDLRMCRNLLRMRKEFGNLNAASNYINRLYNSKEASFMIDIVDRIVEDEKEGSRNMRKLQRTFLRKLIFEKYSNLVHPQRHELRNILTKLGNELKIFFEDNSAKKNDNAQYGMSNPNSVHRAEENKKTINNKTNQATTISNDSKSYRKIKKVHNTSRSDFVLRSTNYETGEKSQQDIDRDNTIDSTGDEVNEPQADWLESNISTMRVYEDKHLVTKNDINDNQIGIINRVYERNLEANTSNNIEMTEPTVTRIINIGELLNNNKEDVNLNGYQLRAKQNESGNYYEIIIDPAKCRDDKSADIIIVQ